MAGVGSTGWALRVGTRIGGLPVALITCGGPSLLGGAAEYGDPSQPWGGFLLLENFWLPVTFFLFLLLLLRGPGGLVLRSSWRFPAGGGLAPSGVGVLPARVSSCSPGLLRMLGSLGGPALSVAGHRLAQTSPVSWPQAQPCFILRSPLVPTFLGWVSL